MTPTTIARTTCGACHGTGHSVGRCMAPAAIAYWREAAQKQRDRAARCLDLAHEFDGRGMTGNADYQRRAALVAMEDAAKADRKRARVEAVLR